MKTLFRLLLMSCFLILACFGLCVAVSEIYDVIAMAGQYDLIVESVVVLAGLLLTLPLLLYVRSLLRIWRAEQSDGSYIALFKSTAENLKNSIWKDIHVIEEDTNEKERLISQFRKDYNHFFHDQGKGVHENTPLQNTATQIYWNTLSLQKRRLDKKGITMSMEAQRMYYGKEIAPVYGNMIFDGKYEISYLSEMVNAVRSFFRDGKRIAEFRSKEVAKYRMLNARKAEAGLIVCPNCGSLSTRENLIDGCDYCGTRFTIEDLGMRVSDFGIYPEAAVEYKKYKDSRSRYALRVGLFTAIPSVIGMAIYSIYSIRYQPMEYGLFFDICFMFIVSMIAAWALVLAAMGIFFVTVFPILQAKASFRYLGKKALKGLKNSEKHNQEAEEHIREYDKWFSLAGFYANVQNKLAVLHYADNSRQMEAFGEGEQIRDAFDDLPERYANVVNMDISSMVINDYRIDSEQQNVDVTANITLLELEKESIVKRDEKIRIKLIKDKNCLTQEVAEPEILTCKHCGSSLSLLDGKICKACGSVRHLSKYDWAIEEYKSLNSHGRKLK